MKEITMEEIKAFRRLAYDILTASAIGKNIVVNVPSRFGDYLVSVITKQSHMYYCFNLSNKKGDRLELLIGLTNSADPPKIKKGIGRNSIAQKSLEDPEKLIFTTDYLPGMEAKDILDGMRKAFDKTVSTPIESSSKSTLKLETVDKKAIELIKIKTTSSSIKTDSASFKPPSFLPPLKRPGDVSTTHASHTIFPPIPKKTIILPPISGASPLQKQDENKLNK